MYSGITRGFSCHGQTRVKETLGIIPYVKVKDVNKRFVRILCNRVCFFDIN